MKIIVKVKVNARKNEVEKIDDGRYLVHTTAIPADNKANEKVVELVGEYFGIAKSRLRIDKGAHAQVKVIEILA